LRRIRAPKFREPHEGERIVNPADNFRRRDAGAAQAERDIVPYIEPGEGRVFLKHDADVLRHGAGDRSPVHLDRARRRREQPRDDLQQRTLAAAGRPDHADELAAPEIEIERAERSHRAVTGAGQDRCAKCRAARRGYRKRRSPYPAWLPLSRG